jgi:hypothetical protein
MFRSGIEGQRIRCATDFRQPVEKTAQKRLASTAESISND